jgi:hypothetical protein
MNKLLLKQKIEEARQRLNVAEQELEAGMQKVTDAQYGEKTIVARLLESAFSKLREAKRHVVDLTELLDAEIVDLVEPLPAQRQCPACHKSIMAAATLCGYCWLKLA